MLQSPLKWIILCGPVNLGANFDFCQENYFCLAEQVVALKNYGGGQHSSCTVDKQHRSHFCYFGEPLLAQKAVFS
jgi:hypothetical protein